MYDFVGTPLPTGSAAPMRTKTLDGSLDLFGSALSCLLLLFRSGVRIAAHHLHRLPAAQFLQHMERGPGLHMSACPCVALIVPPEVFDASTAEGQLPCLGIHFLVGYAAECKNPFRVHVHLAPEHQNHFSGGSELLLLTLAFMDLGEAYTWL